MIDELIIVSKKKAKQMIDESPGDFIVFSKMNFPSVKLSKETGKSFLDKSEQIKYSDNDIFGILSMQESIADTVIHDILFAQSESNKKYTNKY